MQVQTIQRQVYVVDGKEFSTIEAAEAYAATQEHIVEVRKFGDEYAASKGSGPKGAVAATNVVLAYIAWKAKQDSKMVARTAEEQTAHETQGENIAA